MDHFGYEIKMRRESGNRKVVMDTIIIGASQRGKTMARHPLYLTLDKSLSMAAPSNGTTITLLP